MPVLAICRGIQIVNVALGGTLFQDLPSERPSDINHNQSHDRASRTHDVIVTPGTRLAAAIGATSVSVNSYHHQAVDRLADGLRLSAVAPDGVIEGVEAEDADWWMTAVQWHPEDLTDDVKGWDRGIFKAFAGCSARCGGRERGAAAARAENRQRNSSRTCRMRRSGD